MEVSLEEESVERSIVNMKQETDLQGGIKLESLDDVSVEDGLVSDVGNYSKLICTKNETEEVSVKEEDLESDNYNPEAEDQPGHPWPHLGNYFILKYWEDKKAVFSCVLCRPEDVVIKGHIRSLWNLKTHVWRKHRPEYIQFEENVKAGSGRGRKRKRQASDSSSRSQSASPALQRAHQLSSIGAAGGVRQGEVDKKIIDFFVSNMLSLKVVDSPSFTSLVTTLNSSKTVMSRRTLGRRIIDSHKELEQRVIRLLEKVRWVATTADGWSAHNEAYLAMTAHWVDPKTRARRHALLAFSRLPGPLTSDVLARAMVGVHVKFKIQDKVTWTTTDNGSNCVEAFAEFASESGVVPELPAGDSDDDDGESSNVDGQEVEVPVDDAEAMQVLSLAETLDQSSSDGGVGYDLPKRMRCAAHTLNLVATADVGKAIRTQSNLRSAYRRAMGKAQCLWNQQTRSTLAAGAIQKKLGRRLVVPKATRWNSTYDSVKLLNDFFDGGKRAALKKVMTQLKLQSFSEADVSFLREYIQVMVYVAKALDVLQGESRAYLGCLLPTLAITRKKLRETKNRTALQYCEPLVDAMLEGIERRFGPLFKDLDCQLGAAFHPMFRLTWMEQHDASQVSTVKRAMEAAVETAMREMPEDASKASSIGEAEDDEADFFEGMTHSQEHTSSHNSTRSKAQAMVKAWLEDIWKKDDKLADRAFRNEPVLMRVFAKYNTTIPSSASVERLFSMGKDVLRAKRATLSDDSLERLIFLKGNRQHAEDKE